MKIEEDSQQEMIRNSKRSDGDEVKKLTYYDLVSQPKAKRAISMKNESEQSKEEMVKDNNFLNFL